MSEGPTTSGGVLDLAIGKKIKVHATKNAIRYVTGIIIIWILAWVYVEKMKMITNLKRQVSNMRMEIEKGKP